jgi:acyl-CoA hydrolase
MMSPSDDATPTWNGDYESPTRKPKPSSCTVLADVVGGALGVGDGTVGDGTLLPLGSVFDIVDLAAGRASYGFVEGPVVTVSVDRGELLRPIRRGDFVRASARVVAVGSSSVTVRVTTAKELLRAGRAPEFMLCFEAQLTFVAINKANGRPYKNVPKLTGVEDGREGEVASVADEVAEVKASIRETAALLGKIDLDPVSALPISAETAETAGLRTSLLSLDDSRVEFRKQYLPRHENFGGNVFGTLRAADGLAMQSLALVSWCCV